MTHMASKEMPRPLAEAYPFIFEHSRDGIFILGEGGQILDANPAACRLLGYRRDELLDTDPRQLHAPRSARTLAQGLEQGSRFGTTDFAAELTHHDGSAIPVSIQLRAVERNGETLFLAFWRPRDGNPSRDIEYAKIIQATGEGFWMVDVHTARIVDANDTFCQMVGYRRDELLSMTISDLEVVESPAETAAHIKKVMETGHDMFETRHRHKHGHILDFEISVSYADIRGGVIFVFTRDISERKRQEEFQQLASLVVNTSTATVMVTDAENRIVSVNPAFTQMTGYRPNEVIGYNPNLLSSGRQSREFYEAVWHTLLESGHWEGEWWNRRKDGEEYAEQVNLTLLRNKDGSVFRHVKIASDITEKKRLDDRIWQQANYDTVTHLPNRRLFLDRLRHHIKKCERTGEALAVFYLDLDHFKAVNDRYGHTTGDMLLIHAARRISSCIRGSDTVARLGGDEFAVLLTDLANTSRVDTVASNILHLLAEPFRLGEMEVSISGSVGIAIYPTHGMEIEELIDKADLAMYTAKHNGKNCFSYAL